MYRLLRPFLFILDAELAHRFAMGILGIVLRFALVRAIVRWLHRVHTPPLHQSIWGIEFDNPVGLAAGFDKNATHFNELGAFGFGFIEIGTLTGEGQPGNDRPRLFRLPKDRALLNRMGFNNEGSEAAARRLSRGPIEPVLGVNIGKTKAVALDGAASDYEKSLRLLWDYGRYFVVNVSSPNTPGLRALQNKEPLEALLGHLQRVNAELAAARHQTPRPLLVKIAPDISDEELDDILEVVRTCKIAGIVATNTTIDRSGLRTPGHEDLGSGGISGAPVRARALHVIRQVYRKTNGRVPIVGVGGIFTAEDALETIEAGATLVQVWTGFVYRGPSMVRRINRGLERLLDERGYAHIGEAIGRNAWPRQLEAAPGPEPGGQRPQQ